MRVILGGAVLAASLAGIVQSQDNTQRCIWHEWEESDFDDEYQNFSRKFDNQADAIYLGDNWKADFDPEDMYDSWESFFWANGEEYAVGNEPTDETQTPQRIERQYRPLGFRLAKLYPQNRWHPCFKVEGTLGHKVELMIETFQNQAPITVTDLDKSGFYRQEEGNVDGAGTGQYYHCFTANSNSENSDSADNNKDFLNVAVTCENGCEDWETDMLWRFRRSRLTWTDEVFSRPDDIVDMWCMMIASQIKWPSQISQGTPEEVQEASNKNLSGAHALSVSAVVAAIFAFAGLINA